jgi:hypothetical protein
MYICSRPCRKTRELYIGAHNNGFNLAQAQRQLQNCHSFFFTWTAGSEEMVQRLFSAGTDISDDIYSHALLPMWGHVTGYALAWFGLVGDRARTQKVFTLAFPSLHSSSMTYCVYIHWHIYQVFTSSWRTDDTRLVHSFSEQNYIHIYCMYTCQYRFIDFPVRQNKYIFIL